VPRRKKDELPSSATAHLIDTNVIMRFLMGDDQAKAARVTALMRRVEFGKETVEITEVVVMEAVWTLTEFYKIPRKQVSERLTEFFEIPGVRVPSRGICLRALRDYAETTADFVDCLIAARSRTRSIPIYSFDDSDFKKLACDWKNP